MPTAVKSPCRGLCEIDDGTKWCLGCLRTLEEIATWHVMSDDEKRQVYGRLHARQNVMNGDFS